MARLVPLAILGYGTVGRGVLEALHAKGALAPGVDARACTVCTRCTGSAPSRTHRSRASFALARSEKRSGVVVEVMGGTSAARCAVHASCGLASTPFVTANKVLLSCYGPEARLCGLGVLAEAAVAGGLPVIAVAHRCTPAAGLSHAAGVLNSTANWVLTSMCRYGLPLRRAMLEAIARGYAEADCACDVDGTDAAQKLAVLGSWCPGAHIMPRSLYTEGMRGVRTQECACALALGLDVKLLSLVSHGGAMVAQVRPFMASSRCPVACGVGVTNAVFLAGDSTGAMWLYGRGAGRRPTAAAVCSDVVAAAQSAAARSRAPARASYARRARARMICKCYLRACFITQPACKAALARCMRRQTITARLVLSSCSTACVALLGATHDLVLISLVAHDPDVRYARFMRVVL
ncbi:putative homoserine dehydrogenase [Candidatus Tremblaya princeps PCIT]|uniref:homoserine dehydrogenase n=1 Tax=Tremblaya princeps (strain PCIT) TaxID=891398 RepID=F7XYE9_TREPP|nr:putative homoserine dehydrogenase [Candidatus Tremblaya princeps PCIT]AEK38409.1 homoserine dehydrogenase [Candidatus Tremblaya princeps PCVAL]